MLSKLRWLRLAGDGATDLHRDGPSPNLLLADIGWQGAAAERVEHGTLSASFLVRFGDSAAFLKTHLTPGGRASLEREAQILSVLYSETLSLEFQCLREPRTDRLWLKMPVLESNQAPLRPKQVIALLNSLVLQRVRQLHPGIIDTDRDNIQALIDAGKRAHIDLSTHNLLDSQARATAVEALNLLDRHISDLDPVLCHGDLSPFNVMRHKGAPILIDWEDAFLGVTDYDYLFWLTFFENRDLYRTGPLQHISIHRQVARAVLIMIVLLKCELAWRSNTWRHHSLGFDHRIREIAQLV